MVEEALISVLIQGFSAGHVLSFHKSKSGFCSLHFTYCNLQKDSYVFPSFPQAGPFWAEVLSQSKSEQSHVGFLKYPIWQTEFPGHFSALQGSVNYLK